LQFLKLKAQIAKQKDQSWNSLLEYISEIQKGRYIALFASLFLLYALFFVL